MKVSLYLWNTHTHFTVDDAIEEEDIHLVADYLEEGEECQKVADAIQNTLDAMHDDYYKIHKMSWIDSEEFQNDENCAEGSM